MIVKDWVKNAAIDIAIDIADNGLAVSTIKEIISKHCPFKPDAAYVEIPASLTPEVNYGMETDVRTLQRMAYSNYQSYAHMVEKLTHERQRNQERLTRLYDLLLESKRGHEAGYLSASSPCATQETLAEDGAVCTCGADEWNARVDEAVDGR